MPEESPQPTPARALPPRELAKPREAISVRKLLSYPSLDGSSNGNECGHDGLESLFEWSRPCQSEIIQEEELVAPGRPRPKPLRTRLRRFYCWVANLGFVILLRTAMITVAVVILLWMLAVTIMMGPSEWPEADADDTMPPECSARHAELQASGVDARLWNVSLPPWEHSSSPQQQGRGRRSIAYLGSCGFLQRLGIVVRVFTHLYREEDVFLYQADPLLGVHDPLVEVLSSRFGGSLPANVRVTLMPHTGRVFYWGHTANVIAALRELLDWKQDWEWLIRLHDSAYPMHAPEYMRSYLESQPGTSFMDLKPWMPLHWMSRRIHLVHACGPWVGRITNQRFPHAELQRNGFSWAWGDEWWVITRSLALYFVDTRLQPFLELMQHRVNVEEIFWASVVSNIPNFQQMIAESVVWWTFSGMEDWRDAKHSPDNIVDERLDMYFDEIKRRWQDSFFVRKVQVGHSDDLMRWLDKAIERERLFYTGTPVAREPR